MKCAKCGKKLWVYLIRHNFPWQQPKTEKWCPKCAGLSKILGDK